MEKPLNPVGLGVLFLGVHPNNPYLIIPGLT